MTIDRTKGVGSVPARAFRSYLNVLRAALRMDNSMLEQRLRAFCDLKRLGYPNVEILRSAARVVKGIIRKLIQSEEMQAKLRKEGAERYFNELCTSLVKDVGSGKIPEMAPNLDREGTHTIGTAVEAIGIAVAFVRDQMASRKA